MKLATFPLGLALPLCAFALLACDAKDGSVTGTATGAGSTGTGSTAGDASDGTTGEPSDTGGAESSGGVSEGQCVQDETPIGLDEDSAVGLTPQQLLDDAVGTYAGAMQWMQEGPVQFEGEAGPTGVEIEISYDGGEARSVEGELLAPCNHDGPCPCPDALEVDVGLRVTSEDGLFAEQFDAALVFEVDDSGFSGGGTSIRLRFQPDDTAGTFSASALDIDDAFVLNYLEFGLQPGGGALDGSLNAEVEGMGFLGFGVVASLGAVRDLQACAAFGTAGSACGLAGCTEVQGQPLFGSPPDDCSCSTPQRFCFPAPLEGDDVSTLYTRQVDDGFEVFDEVVEFPVSTQLGGDWRTCADAPEVERCSCEISCG